MAEFSRLISLKPECVMEMVARAEKLGFSRNTAMFKSALRTVKCASPKTVSAKMDLLKMTLGCSEAEPALMVRKAPQILRISDGKLSRTLKFLTVEVGLNLQYIMRRPQMLAYSMDRRMMPRHYVIKVLKAKGLSKGDADFYNAICLTNKRFVQKFLDPYNKRIPGLADAYATACAGKMPHEIKL